jgi:hypothetical protein
MAPSDYDKKNRLPDIVYEHDAHGAPVVGGGDGTKALLARRVPDLQLDLLPVQLDRPDLEVDP